MNYTKHRKTGGNNMAKSPLANKLKQLRVENNLSITVLAEQLGISGPHISYLENDKRGTADDKLKKYADFFNFDFEKLKELQSNSLSFINSNSDDDSANNFEEVDEFLTMIVSVEDGLRTKFINECKEKLQEMYFTLLTPYGLNDVKRSLNNLRNNWYSLDEIEMKEEELTGNLKLPEHEIYFKLVLREDVCKLDLLYEDQRKIEHFTKWLTQPDCTITNHQKIPHLEDEQKVKTHYWFSPRYTENDQFYFLKEQHEDLSQLFIESFKLKMIVKNFLKSEDEAS